MMHKTCKNQWVFVERNRVMVTYGLVYKKTNKQKSHLSESTMQKINKLNV